MKLEKQRIECDDISIIIKDYVGIIPIMISPIEDAVLAARAIIYDTKQGIDVVDR